MPFYVSYGDYSYEVPKSVVYIETLCGARLGGFFWGLGFVWAGAGKVH